VDPTLRSVPADRSLRIEALLERARRLSGPEIRVLVGAVRGEGRPGERDPAEGERRGARNRVISIATRRSGLAREARALGDLSASAVQAAAERPGGAGSRDRLGLLCDAKLAVADAALAILLEDHLSADVAGRLSLPFDRATAITSGADGPPGPRPGLPPAAPAPLLVTEAP
jgi:hypothetical protein